MHTQIHTCLQKYRYFYFKTPKQNRWNSRYAYTYEGRGRYATIAKTGVFLWMHATSLSKNLTGQRNYTGMTDQTEKGVRAENITVFQRLWRTAKKPERKYSKTITIALPLSMKWSERDVFVFGNLHKFYKRWGKVTTDNTLGERVCVMCVWVC